MRVKNDNRLLSIIAVISLFMPTLLVYFDSVLKGILASAVVWTSPTLICYIIFGILFLKQDIDKSIFRILGTVGLVMSVGKLITLIDYRSYIRLFLRGNSLNKEIIVVLAHSLCMLIVAVMFFVCSSKPTPVKTDILSALWIMPSIIYFLTDFVFIFFFKMSAKWIYEPLNIVSFISLPIAYFSIGFWVKRMVVDRCRGLYFV